MRIEDDITTLMLNEPDITDLVGQRIYPMKLNAKQTYPAITIQRISKTMSDRSRENVMNNPVLQITVWDKDFTKVHEVAEVLVKKLDGFSGFMSKGITTIFQVGGNSLYDPDSQVYYEPLDFEVSHEKERV